MSSVPKKKINENKNNQKEYTFGPDDSRAVVTVWCDGRDYDPSLEGYKPIYSYQIKTSEWSYIANDIRGGLNEVPNLYAASQSLFAFLYTCCTSSDVEDHLMFPDYVREWGNDFTDEFSMLSLEAAGVAQSAVPSSVPDQDIEEDVFGIDEA